jgi:hypothetical protein
MRIQQEVSLSLSVNVQTFILLSTDSSLIPFQAYMRQGQSLLSLPMNIKQTIHSKPSPLYSILHFAYPHQYSQNRHNKQKRRTDRSFMNNYITYVDET